MTINKMIGKRIKIIGDSIAAGQGSSSSYEMEQLIFTGHKPFYRYAAPNSWWGLLEAYLLAANDKSKVINNGCCGAYSSEILAHITELVTKDDAVIFLLLGLNDRKKKNGMTALKQNLEKLIVYLQQEGKRVILLTPNPSTTENEYRASRLYHTEQVVQIIRAVANEKKVLLIDLYESILKYLMNNAVKLEDIMYKGQETGDGLHPGDFVQRLMYDHILEVLQIESEHKE